MKIKLLAALFLLELTQTAFANDDLGLLVDDCYKEWQTRQWVIGEDQTPAHLVPKFSQGIKRICATRVRLFKTDSDISPYIQGRLAEVAPYVFNSDQQAIEALIRKIETRPAGPRFSGAYMRD